MGYISVANCPHVTVFKDPFNSDYRVSYKGLRPERAEAMAYYTGDRDDAIAMTQSMERDRHTHVVDGDIQDIAHWPERK